MRRRFAYLKDGAAIYRQSFAIIRREAELERFSPSEERVAVRIIHACGMAEAARDLFFAPGVAGAAELALRAGAPIFCDSRMVAEGVTRFRLPALLLGRIGARAITMNCFQSFSTESARSGNRKAELQTARFDPSLPFKIGPTNGREA